MAGWAQTVEERLSAVRTALKRDPLSELPERVHRSVEAHARQSERLVSWAQLALIAIFVVLYAISPRPGDAGMLTPVPSALALYTCFTLARLVLSYRRSLSEALVVVSIVADMALLLVLIWAFHVEYGQPAAFSLKVPTFVYIFVFIALRALRFEYRYVLMAGTTAAVGWVLLAVMAVRATGYEAVTRSFVSYLTSNRILIGAEVDKVVAIVMVTIILALTVWRAQTTLVKAVREETAAREIGRFLSRGVAEVIAGAITRVEAGTAVERHAAIVMLDIRGFSRISTSLPPADVVRLLSDLHSRVIPHIQANGGVVDKFLGDGLMATFGAVSPRPTPEADAVRALVAIVDEAARWTDETAAIPGGHRLMVNGALAAGSVVFATLGSVDRLEYTVIGEAANLAAKLEKHNKIAGTRALVEAASYDRAVAQGYAPRSVHGRLGAQQLHGVDGAVDIVVLSA